MPNQMKDFSQSLISVSFFVSNILFWRKTGYFSNSSEEKPLLHTWSLAVEEQYYLLFPIFLILVWKFGKNKVFWIIILLASISLLLSEWGWRNQSRANFYLAPTRAWEIFAGSLCAFLIKKNKFKSNNFLSFVGLILIVLSIFVYDEKTPFPSIYALIPVSGTVILILYSNKDTYVSKFLSKKLLVYIGLLSYSAYLWHQPIFAFLRIYLNKKPDLLVILLLILISFFVAFLSWRFIEKPFRDKNKIKKKTFIVISLIAFLFLITIGFIGSITNGFQQQMVNYKYSNNKKIYKSVFESTNYNMYNKMYFNDCNFWIKNTKNINKKKFENCYNKFGKTTILLGDSHAMNLYNVAGKSRHFNFLIGVSQGACRPHNNHKFCHYNEFENFLNNNASKIKKIIYHQSGSYFIKDIRGRVDSQQAFEGKFGSFHKDNIIKIIKYLEDLSKKYNIEIQWVGPFLEYRYDPLEVLGQSKSFSVNPESIKIFKSLNSELSKFESLSKYEIPPVKEFLQWSNFS